MYDLFTKHFLYAAVFNLLDSTLPEHLSECDHGLFLKWAAPPISNFNHKYCVMLYIIIRNQLMFTIHYTASISFDGWVVGTLIHQYFQMCFHTFRINLHIVCCISPSGLSQTSSVYHEHLSSSLQLRQPSLNREGGGGEERNEKSCWNNYCGSSTTVTFW